MLHLFASTRHSGEIFDVTHRRKRGAEEKNSFGGYCTRSVNVFHIVDCNRVISHQD